MPELELRLEPNEASEPINRFVGIQAACLAAVLAVATISSHRTHTQAVVLKTEANDQWSFFQSKKLKSHILELGNDLLSALTAKDERQAAVLHNSYKESQARYERESASIQQKAETLSEASELAERKALRFDLGEGLLEMGLVLASLFFVAKRKIFPVMSLIAGLAGTILALSGFLLG